MMMHFTKYYISRVLLALVFGTLSYVLGASWLAAVSVTLGALAVFLYLPHSGRYLAAPEDSVTPFRLDEYGRMMMDRAARDGFIALSLGFFLLHLYGALTKREITMRSVDILFMGGWLTYFLSDFWRGRRGA